MKKALLFVTGLIVAGMMKADAQVITIGHDTTICPGTSLTLTATVPSFSATAPTTILFGPSPGYGAYDDAMSTTWIPIGFNFTFYGNTYNQCLVSSNGYVQFTGTPGGYSPWAIGGGIPSAAAPLNCIMAPWQDTYPGYNNPTNEFARYKTFGTAPNRVFVVEFMDIPMFSCWTFCFGTQIKLYEGTNVIETHISYKTLCNSWNNGYAIHGIQNASGTVAHVVPGRNFPAVWSATADGKRWTPTSATNYTLTNIPFNPSYMPAALPPTAVSWLANGTPMGTGLSVNVTPAANTTYIARLNYSSCSQVVSFSDTMRVFMGSLPLTTSGNTAICIGDSTDLSVSTTASGTTNFVWNPAGTLLNNTTATPTAFPSATTTYTVTATNGLCSNSAQLTVNVNPLPNITFNVTDPSICPGDSVQLVASGGVTYSWYPPTDLSNPSSNSTYASPLINTQYGVVVVDGNNCMDSAFNNVLLHTPPTVSITTSEPSICPGKTMGLSANGAATYIWSPASGLDFTNLPNPNATVSVNATYQAIGTDVNGCKDTAEVTVLVDPLPVLSFTGQPLEGCEPLTVNFQNQTNISSGNVVGYNWTFQGHGTSSLTDPVVTFPADGNYDVSLVAVSDSGCVDSITLNDIVKVYNVPTAGFYGTPQPTTIGDPEIFFVNTSSGDVAYWNWDFAGLGSSTFSNPSFNFTIAGDYVITQIVETVHGCSDTISNTITMDDLSEIFIPNSFTPNHDGLNDTWFPVGRNLNTQNLYIEVHVFNRWGTRVFRSTTSDKPWNGLDQNIGDKCPEGMYSYRVIFVNEQGKEKRVMGHVNLLR